MAAVKRRSELLQQGGGELDPELAEKLAEQNNSQFYEAVMLGAIEGGTSNFNDDCKGGLQNMVRSAFTVIQTSSFWLPKNSAKFNLANVALTESSNIVYAHCSVDHLAEQLGQVIDISDPDDLIIVGSRVAGAMINTVPELWDCVKEGNAKRDGFMSGLCGAQIFTTLLDVSL